MDFSLNKREELFLQMIREFAENEVKPLAAEVDEQERFPMETVEKMAKIGIMGIPIPVEYGGQGGTNQMYIMAVEELSRVCATTGVIVSAHTSLCMNPILEFGTEEQKQILNDSRKWNVELGKGIVDFRAIVDAAEAQGCEAYVNEREYYQLASVPDGDPVKCAALDYAYLRSL